MNTEYVVFVRKVTNPTILPKPFQMKDKVKFFVRKKLAHKFPAGFSHRAIHMADLIMVDGQIIKNVVK